MNKIKLIGVGFVFVWFFFGGIAHFTSAGFFTAIVPPYIPFPLATVYISGVIEIAAAIALLFKGSRKVAGAVLFALTIAVSPANIHMWLNPELFPDVSEVFLSLRLVVQVALLACIWWSTNLSLPRMNRALTT